MKLTLKPPRYQKERQLTDESLTVERGDVTVAYVHNAVKTEDETDQAVKRDRLRADEARAQMRTDGPQWHYGLHLFWKVPTV